MSRLLKAIIILNGVAALGFLLLGDIEGARFSFIVAALFFAAEYAASRTPEVHEIAGEGAQIRNHLVVTAMSSAWRSIPPTTPGWYWLRQWPPYPAKDLGYTISLVEIQHTDDDKVRLLRFGAPAAVFADYTSLATYLAPSGRTVWSRATPPPTEDPE